MTKKNPTKTNSRLAICAGAVFTAALAMAAPRKSQNHVPAVLDDEIRPFYAAAAATPHIALVNVAGAIPEEDWRLAATYAASRLQVNIWTNSIPASVTDKLIADPAYVAKALGNENAKVGVFFERRGKGCRLLSAPGAWAVVDVASLSEGSPDAQTLRDRYAKVILKGLAEAVGGGATLEPFCAMFYGSQDLEGMDSTNITLAPMCYFPMLEILRQIGGVDMTRAIQSAEE